MSLLAGKCGCGLVGRAILATGVELLWLPWKFSPAPSSSCQLLRLVYCIPALCLWESHVLMISKLKSVGNFSRA